MSFMTNTDEQMRIDSSGNVGIGTASPGNTLDVAGAVELGENTASDTPGNSLKLIYTDSTNDLFGWRMSSGNSYLVLDRKYSGSWDDVLSVQRSNGNVGIGTTSPNHPLTVNGEALANYYLTENYGTMIAKKGATGVKITSNFGANGGLGLYSLSGNDIGFLPGGTEAMRINGTTGYVGIGTTTPGRKLSIEGGNNVESSISLNNTANNNYWQITPEYNDQTLRFKNESGTSILVLDDSGNVGIGTTSPSYPLEINGDNAGISLYTSGNISATGFITRTTLYDKSKNVWDYLKDADYYKDKDGKIDHSKYYGYVQNITTTDYLKPINESYEEEVCNYTIENVTVEKCSWIEDLFTNCTEVIEEQLIEDCHNETKIRTTYPYTKQEEGVNLEDEINLLRQAVYELKQQNDLLNSRIEVLENVK